MKLKVIINEMLEDKDFAYKNIFGRGRKVKMDIFVNPTQEELKEAGRIVIRAVKTIEGKIYTVSDQEENGIIHEDLVDIFSEKGYITSDYNEDWWKNPESLNHYVCIARHRGKWVISESYNQMLPTRDSSIDRRNKAANWKSFTQIIKSKYRNVITEID